MRFEQQLETDKGLRASEGFFSFSDFQNWNPVGFRKALAYGAYFSYYNLFSYILANARGSSPSKESACVGGRTGRQPHPVGPVTATQVTEKRFEFSRNGKVCAAEHLLAELSHHHSCCGIGARPRFRCTALIALRQSSAAAPPSPSPRCVRLGSGTGLMHTNSGPQSQYQLQSRSSVGIRLKGAQPNDVEKEKRETRLAPCPTTTPLSLLVEVDPG